MKLDHECIRDILLTIEDMDYTLSGLPKEEFEIQPRIQKYESKQVLYTLKRLDDAGFIECAFSKGEAFFHFYMVHTITYQGHQILDDIRDDKVWKLTKEKASKLASVSLPILQQIAASIVQKMYDLK
ncbi:DUF2513 domain-containing protein [Staphylococcus chromogenes]|uniref:DUF2513 domain-containing protein n=1 Tax=Staphylococcus chromogenes TaxID=46126 RepID=UPI000D1AF92B|nr:DUF2513 domain-containing protein [Staphylococcus chromogenes]PTF68116.1 hypothetical protein BUY01_09390 [Staphylococcus chromogenes]PTG82279.1 hypothetical protein BU665_08190 [Staphylococcus chromogenes]